MAFTDPQSATIDSSAVSLPRLLTGTVVGRFVSNDGNLELVVDPRGTAKRRRSSAKLYIRKPIEDPVTGLTRLEQHMVSITTDRPLTGITDQDAIDAFTALFGWATAGTNANLKKLVGGEN